MSWILFFSLGVLFGALAGAIAYIVLYQDYIRRFSTSEARARALQGALVAFLIFLGLSIVSGYVITSMSMTSTSLHNFAALGYS
jgi:hypothetical protein